MKRLSDGQYVAALRGSTDTLPAWFGRRVAELFGHADYLVREAAIRAVGRCRARKYVPHLITALHDRADRDYSLQVAAAESLGLINDLSFLPHLQKEWFGAELLNVRRVAREQLDGILAAHQLRGRHGFGKNQDRILNDPDHEAPAGTDSIHARQIDEQVRLTETTVPILYESPAFCRYCAGQRPVLERAMAALLPLTASEEKVALTMLAWLCRGMVKPTARAESRYREWWQAASESIALQEDWEEEAILARGSGSCDKLARSLIALCRVRQVPGRLIIWYHANDRRQHVMAELFVDGRWAVYDPLLGLSWAHTAWELLRKSQRAGKAHVVRPLSAHRREMMQTFGSPEIFTQAGIVPVDRMGIDY